MAELVIDERFRGPPESGNGGYVAGALAAHVDAPAVEVRLVTPPPLGRPLAVVRGAEGQVELRDGERVVAIARPGRLELEIPDPVSLEEAIAAASRTRARPEDHPFPTCFGCGPRRERGDALRHVCGPVDGRDLVACPATTSPALPTTPGGALAPEVVWAALDCPSAAAVVPPGAPAHVLGTFTARLERPVRAGEPHVCMAWPLRSDGRKKWAASAVLDASGRVCALAEALWIELRPAG
jgi:hypothetical protein